MIERTSELLPLFQNQLEEEITAEFKEIALEKPKTPEEVLAKILHRQSLYLFVSLLTLGFNISMFAGMVTTTLAGMKLNPETLEVLKQGFMSATGIAVAYHYKYRFSYAKSDRLMFARYRQALNELATPNPDLDKVKKMVGPLSRFLLHAFDVQK